MKHAVFFIFILMYTLMAASCAVAPVVQPEPEPVDRSAYFDSEGYNVVTGFNVEGWNRANMHQETGTLFNPNGFNRAGFNAMGFNSAGFNAMGFNAQGFNAAGMHQTTGTLFDPDGFNQAGFNADGWNRQNTHRDTGTLFNPDGFNIAGFNAMGFNAGGFNAAGTHQTTGTLYNPDNINAAGAGRPFFPYPSRNIDLSTLESTINNVVSVEYNLFPYGIWSNNETMWVSSSLPNVQELTSLLLAVDLATGEYTPQFNFTLFTDTNSAPRGIWSDSQNMLVVNELDQSNDTGDGVIVYDFQTRHPNSNRNLLIGTSSPLGNDPNITFEGIWSDGTILWIVYNNQAGDTNTLRAFNLADGSSLSARDITLEEPSPTSVGHTTPSGIWSNGRTMWVANRSKPLCGLYAYNLSSGAREPSLDFNNLADGNQSPRGIWSNGSIMWVVQNNSTTIYAYHMPPQ